MTRHQAAGVVGVAVGVIAILHAAGRMATGDATVLELFALVIVVNLTRR